MSAVATSGLACVVFDRIGRTRDVELVTDVDLSDDDAADRLAAAVHHQARRYLMSSDYEVLVDLERGTVSLGYGRYGSGRIEAAS